MPMLKNALILDCSTAPIEGVEQFIDDSDIQAPSNYGEEAAKKYIEKERLKKIDKAGLDLDLCRITGIGLYGVNPRGSDKPQTIIHVCKSEDEERLLLQMTATSLNQGSTLVGFNSLRFDWPLLMRRALYLGVKFPKISLDRYRTPHVDLFDVLTNHGSLTAHSLKFYASRFQWLDVEKPSSGAEESRVFSTGNWKDLETSLRHDVTITKRLAEKLGYL